jgi:putative ABC transport system substrate-binding protein
VWRSGTHDAPSEVRVCTICPRKARSSSAKRCRISTASRSCLIVVLDLVTIRAASTIAELAAKHRLPGFHAYREFADAGGLMSYGFTGPGIMEAAVEYADKVLRGARPADLPMEQPRRNEFVINLETAKALGLKIPHSVLVRASHVIE